MSRRVRLLSERQLKAIGDNGLHISLVEDLDEHVERALDGLARALPEDTLQLAVVAETLAGLLKAQSAIRELVVEVAGLGGSRLSESEFYDALAIWIIDNQIGGGFDWEPSTRPARPN